MKVLVVDGYRTARRIIIDMLNKLGYTQVDQAADGSEALIKLSFTRYDLIIWDWHMEPMTGLALLTAIRDDEKLKSTPFIMVTAESKTENVIRAKEAGANSYIIKPFNAATLKVKIENVLGISST